MLDKVDDNLPLGMFGVEYSLLKRFLDLFNVREDESKDIDSFIRYMQINYGQFFHKSRYFKESCKLSNRNDMKIYQIFINTEGIKDYRCRKLIRSYLNHPDQGLVSGIRKRLSRGEKPMRIVRFILFYSTLSI